MHTFEAALPQTYRVLHRDPWYYGSTQFLGNDFTFDYTFTFTDQAFEDNFFGWLGGQGEPGDLIAFQEWYNDEEYNVLDVTEPVRYIDGPSIEAMYDYPDM
jgi:hypothetical protein